MWRASVFALTGLAVSVSDCSSTTTDYSPPPSAPTIRIVTADGTTFDGMCQIAVGDDGQRAPTGEVNINAGSANGSKWAAQLVPAVDDVRTGTAVVVLKPWSQLAGTGFIDDQTEAPRFSQSGTATLRFGAGGHLSGSVQTDTDRFSGTLEGHCTFGCSPPPSQRPSSPAPGDGSGDKATFATPFCAPFAVFR